MPVGGEKTTHNRVSVHKLRIFREIAVDGQIVILKKRKPAGIIQFPPHRGDGLADLTGVIEKRTAGVGGQGDAEFFFRLESKSRVQKGPVSLDTDLV